MTKIVKNEQAGYFEVEDKPSEAELKAYYEKEYYQNENASYAHRYSPEEIAFKFSKIKVKASIAERLLAGQKQLSLLDIGCGEGFVLKAFQDQGWTVKGLDYSNFGCQTHQPEVADTVTAGNIYDNIDQLITAGQTYDLIWLDNVLEHVNDVDSLLAKCRALARPHSILSITVPNDFSQLQLELLEEGKISREFWVKTPDHLSYFTAPSLRQLLEQAGWATEKIIGDFPIDWFLTNSNSNYIENGQVGKFAHQSRVWLYNHLVKNNDLEAVAQFFESLATVGMGRNITGFFSLESAKS